MIGNLTLFNKNNQEAMMLKKNHRLDNVTYRLKELATIHKMYTCPSKKKKKKVKKKKIENILEIFSLCIGG